MAYSDDDIKELYQKICQSIKNSNKYGYKITSLEDLQKELNRSSRFTKFKGINLQDKCEGGHSLGDLLLKHAAENDNSCVKDLFLKNGFTLSQQEQITAEVTEGEADSNEVNSSNSRNTQFVMSYDKIKEIVTKNPDITVKESYEKLKKEVEASTDKERDTKIFDSFAGAVRSGASITGNRSVFLKVTKLFAGLDTIIYLKSRASKAILDIAVESKQADVVEILLESGKFDEEEKFNALRLAIIQGNIQEAQSFLGSVNNETMQAALGVAIDNGQAEITEMLLNLITPETPNVNENANPTNTSSNNRRANSFTNAQFFPPNEEETKYKESKENFHTSLRNDVVGVVITGLFIAAAVMVPSIAGAAVCGIVAALALVATGLHVKDSTLPSYKEMREVELTKQSYLIPVNTEI